MTSPFRAIALNITTILCAAAFSASATAQNSAGRYALLVGCTTYDNLEKSVYLDGPANDVKLFRELLTGRFGFQNVVTLAEAEGQANLRPTRANIEREFKALAQKAKSGDQVVILMGGHGTQQPNDNPDDETDPEPDGLDEVFLPADIAAWSAETKTIVNAIKDDDLRAWLGAIRATGASIWFIADCCHSGTISREVRSEGVELEKKREIRPDLLVPKDALAAAASRATKTRGGAPLPDGGAGIVESLRGAGSTGELVAMYAALSTEPTVERQLPDEADVTQRRPYGLLTYTINQILTRATAPLSYEELTMRVQQQYAAWGRSFPTPLIEGNGTKKEVLGTREWPGRSLITLKSDQGVLRLTAGALNGLTKNSILAIYPPVGQASGKEPTGYVKIIRTTALDADVMPVEYNNQPASNQLPIGGRAEVVQLDSAVHPLQVALDTGANAPPQSLLAEVRGKMDLPPQAVQFVESSKQANWLLRNTKDGVLLIPAEGLVDARGLVTAASATLESAFGPYPPDVHLAERLAENLGKIARVQHLLSLSEPIDGGRIVAGTINVQLELRRHKNINDKVGVPIDFTAGAVKLEPDELLGCFIHNKGRSAADVTLLYIDENYGILSKYPPAGTTTDNRLQPGQTIGPPDIKRDELTPGTVGMQHMVLIATLGQGPPQSFTWLEQPSIQKVRDITSGDRGIESDLAKLFKGAIYGDGNTRGMKAERVAEHAIRTVSWQFAPTTANK